MDLFYAIKSLKPDSEFVFQNEDYATIEWHKLEGDAPTILEIEEEILRLKSLKETTLAERATAKAALLDRLGITAEEAALLLG